MTKVTTPPLGDAAIVQQQRKKRQQTTQNVATGTAATGTAAYQAKRYASKKYLSGMLDTVNSTARTVEMNAREASSLWSRFKVNSVKFAKDATARLMKLKDNRILGPIVKSKAMRAVTGAFGVVMAAFVLVTGVNDSIKTGRIAVDDLQAKLHNLAA